MSRDLMVRITGAILTCLVGAGVAFADYFTGGELAELSKSERTADAELFRGYVAGVQDYINGQVVCVHPDVRLNQASAVVNKYLKEHPERWHEAAKVMVRDALQAAFPCKPGQK